MVLALTGVMVNGFTVVAQEEHSRQTAPELHHVTHAVQDMQVVVRQREDRMTPHTYTRFAPTQVSMDEETLVIVDTMTESPENATADITIWRKTSGSRGARHPDE